MGEECTTQNWSVPFCWEGAGSARFLNAIFHQKRNQTKAKMRKLETGWCLSVCLGRRPGHFLPDKGRTDSCRMSWLRVFSCGTYATFLHAACMFHIPEQINLQCSSKFWLKKKERRGTEWNKRINFSIQLTRQSLPTLKRSFRCRQWQLRSFSGRHHTAVGSGVAHGSGRPHQGPRGVKLFFFSFSLQKMWGCPVFFVFFLFLFSFFEFYLFIYFFFRCK